MVKPREHRFHVMLSDAELEQLDSWRFANRVATRAEAMRRLCQAGLALDEAAPTLGANEYEIEGSVYSTVEMLVASFQLREEDLRPVIVDAVKALFPLQNTILEQRKILGNISNRTGRFDTAADIEQTLKRNAELEREIESLIVRLSEEDIP